MTNRELVNAAVDLRYRSKTWEEVGEELGYTSQGIRRVVYKSIFGDPRTRKGVGRYVHVNAWTKREGMTLTELSARMGYDKHYVALILRGQRKMPDSFLEKLMEVSKLSREEILVLDEKEKP